ncbi:MAG: hypothetical protein OXD43_08605, partial [Bacteroidetes bacterium]|nr:hypothetical protein [Bacteroidota bacterium]
LLRRADGNGWTRRELNPKSHDRLVDRANLRNVECMGGTPRAAPATTKHRAPGGEKEGVV